MPWWLLPYLVFLLPFGAVIAAVYLWVLIQRNGKRRSPLTRDMLRAPGQSLDAKLREMEGDMLLYALAAPLVPLLTYDIYLSGLIFGHQQNNLFSDLVYFFGGLIVTTFCIYKVIRYAKDARNYRLGLDAERAVGQELSDLLRLGYWVFHDVPADRFNIDHVVVGQNGVFAIETKGRAKPGKDVKESWRVQYDGERLQFPGWVETEPMKQAIRQAKWLQTWLSSAVGEPIVVRPVLALPGWFIERTNPKGIAVINGRNAGNILKNLSKETIPDKLIQQIVHQLDQRCRDVSAKAYAPA